MDDYKFNTLSIHGGDEGKNPENALNYPLFLTSTFTFNDLEHAEKTFSFECKDYVYTRGNNPTTRLLEKRLACLEGGADCVVFSSGMAAISSALLSLLKPGDELIAHQVLYGSSYKVIKEVLPRYGIKTSFIDLTQIDKLKTGITDKTTLIYFETPVNPNLEIIDIKEVSQLCSSHNIKVVVDNTFATPFYQNPLKLGADVVIHSATKYLNGHGDVLAGAVIARDQEYIHELKFNYLTELGGVLSPFNSWLVLRGLKTLGLRMREHEKKCQQDC